MEHNTTPHSWKYFAISFAIFLMGLSLGIYFYSIIPHREAVAQISDFSRHQKVTTDSRLYLAFPGKMDEESVQKNLEIPEGIKGNMHWEDQVLILEPDEKLKEGETITFRVSPQTLLASKRPLNEELTFQFDIGGAPVVSAHFPQTDSVNIASDTKISMVFDRPIIALSAVQGHGAKKYAGEESYSQKWPVTIAPETKGRWRFMGTSAIEFIPEEGWIPATAYTVNVPKGIVTVTGDKTTEDFSWSFTTARPSVQSADPVSGYLTAGPKAAIALFFNQEMDPKQAREKIQLFKKEKADDKASKGVLTAIKIEFGTKEVEGGGREIDKTQLKVTPETPMLFNSPYELVVNEGLKAARGDLGTEAPFSLLFSTAGELTITRGSYEPSSAILLQFSNPIDDKTLKTAISITPPVAKWDEITLETNSWSDNKELNFYPGLEPSTDYVLTISSDLLDQFDQALKEPYTLQFSTPPISEAVIPLNKGKFSIMEKGRPAVIPFQTVNVSRLDFELAPLSFSDFLKIRQGELKNYNLQPDFTQYAGVKKFSVTMKNKKNDYELNDIDFEKKTGALGTGIYVFSVRAPEYRYTDKSRNKQPVVQYRYFTRTNIALTLKYSGSQALVWATDMRTGDPVKGAAITLESSTKKIVKRGVTDNNGFFETEIDIKEFQTKLNERIPEFWVTASTENDFSFLGSSWDQGIEPWLFGMGDDFRGSQSQDFRVNAYVYTERRVYRPGDTVYFKGIIRLLDKKGIFRLPKNKNQIQVTVNDAKGAKIVEKTLHLNEFGSFFGELPLDPKASVGSYVLTATLLPGDDFDNNDASSSFSVLAYRKPEYKIEMASEKEDYFDRETLTFNLKANYYFGAPMSEANVHWVAWSNDYYFNRYTGGWYSFGLSEVWCWRDCSGQRGTITEKDGTLDQKGEYKIQFPVDFQDKGVSQEVVVEADVSDQNNQVVSTRASVPVHKSKVYVGVMPHDYAVEPNQPGKIDLVTVNIDGSPKPNQKVIVKLYSREWNSIKKKSVDGLYYYDNEPKDTYITQENATTGVDGKGSVEFSVAKGGTYRAVAETQDDGGRVAKASAEYYVFSDVYVNWPHSNNDRIDIVADRPQYNVGDTATLLIKSPYQGKGVRALVTVERENIISHRTVDITSNAQPIQVPITKDLIPNAYVSVVILKPRDGETFDENGNDTGMPAFKVGYVQLNIGTEQKKLNIELKTDKPKYGPGEAVDIHVKVTDFKGAPAKTELSLGVVDMSVQDLLGFYLPDLVQQFYSNRGLGVHTAEMLTYLIEVFKPGTKGGGGGDPEGRARTNFKDTAYWNPSLKTNAQGEADVTVKLPDNLTTWQVLAIGNTADHLFGAEAMTFIETKKVILRPVRPRFALVGDTMTVGAIVHNFLDTVQTFTVTLDGSGFKAKGDTKNLLTLQPNENKKITFPIEILPTQKVTFHFKAKSDQAVDEIEESIPAGIFGTPQSVATSGVISATTKNKAMESIFIPPKNEASEGSISAFLSPTLATYLPQGLDYLMHFPYGCAEQTVSSFLPNVVLASLKNLKLLNGIDGKTLETNITAGMERLYSLQRGDGGFGYWDESKESYPYLTAYIIHAFDLAKKAGYHVDSGVIERADAYLELALQEQDLTQNTDLTTRAYILYVMSETGHPDTGRLSNLYSKRKDLPLFAKAYLAMGLNKAGSDKGIAVLKEVLDHVKIDARGAHFEERNNRDYYYAMNTNDRTTALILSAMVRMTPESPIIPNMVRWMLTSRHEGHWDTTQSTVASLLAMIEFLNTTSELDGVFTASVQFNDEKQVTQKFDKSNPLTRKEVTKAFKDMKPDAFTSITLAKDNDSGRLYYDLLLNYFLTLDTIPAAEEGIEIRRDTTLLRDKEENEVEGPFILLETYKVKLTIAVPEDRHFVALESPLPAGFEAIDFNFLQSQERLAGEINTLDNPYQYNPIWRFGHQEFRDDRVLLFADFLPAGVYEYEYLVRTTTPGHFHQPPARIWEMYSPENFGQTEGKWIDIKEND